MGVDDDQGEGASDPAGLTGLLRSRTGHFLLESGHHGDLWLDLDGLFWNPRALAPHVSALADGIGTHGIEVVCGPLVGGAFLAQMVAAELDIGFCYSERRAGQDREGLFPVDYEIPAGLRGGIGGRRVAVVDDAINAGSAVGGTLAALRAAGANPIVVGALLDLNGDRADPPTFDGLPFVSLVTLSARRWIPETCTLCAAGVPLEQPEGD
jgi:orotate phosphoribosyltransferase